MAALTRSFPFDTGAGGNVTEAQWREMAKHWVNDGLISTVGSAMAVTATTGMVLQVAAGAAFIQGHYGALDVATNVTVSAAHATLPRIDRVVLRLDALGNAITAEVVAGTPNVSPTAPALTQTSATWEISLATVAVAAAATSIVSGNITDARTLTTPNNGATQAPTPGAGITVTGTTITAQARLQLPNPFRNASGAIWQRGTSVTPAAGAFGPDGYVNYYRADIVWSRQLSGDTQGSGYCIRVQRPNGNAVTTATGIAQSCLTADSVRFAGRQCTYSIRVRKGSGASVTVSSMNAYTGTGTDQQVGAGLTGSANYSVTPPTLTTAWQTVSVTFTAGASVTQIAAFITLNWSGTAGASDYFEFKDMRLDEGPNVLEHTPLAYAADLTECQRLFWRLGGQIPYQQLAPALCPATTSIYAVIRYPTEMRAAPSVTCAAAALFVAYDGVTVTTGTAIAASVGNISTQDVQINLTGAAGLTQWRPYTLLTNNSTSAYIDFSAEI